MNNYVFENLENLHILWQNVISGFLALLCATTQQSYCRHAGVRRPSVRKTRFLRNCQAD